MRSGRYLSGLYGRVAAGLHDLLVPPPRPEEASAASGDADGADSAAEDEPSKRSAFQSDDPLESPDDDLLDRAPFASRVAEVIRGRSDEASIVFGLYGPWGDGKTTVLNFILSDFPDDDPHYVVVRFNPWLIGDETHLLPAFFSAVAEQLDLKLESRRERVGNFLREYAKALGSISIPLVQAGNAAEAIADLLAPSSLDRKRKQFEAALRETDRRVLVTLDDVDRLDDREIRSVFRLVRLAAPFKRVTYLVACDAEAVARALAREAGGSLATGMDFLEKIVQIPLHIPPATPLALERMVFSGVERILADSKLAYTATQGREIGTRYVRGLEPAITTPRAVKQYLNALSFAAPPLAGEVNPVDLVAVEGIHVGYPRLFEAMRDHLDWFVLPRPFGGASDAEKLRRKARIDALLSDLPDHQADAASYLVSELFPRLGESLKDRSGGPSEEELLAGQNIAHPDYYHRYFTYSLSGEALADSEITSVLEEGEHLVSGLSNLVHRGGRAAVPPLVKRLSAREAGMDATTAQQLLRLLPRLGPAVVDPSAAPGVLFGLSVQEELANLIARLVYRLPTNQRFSSARHVVEAAVPLTFAMDVLRWLNTRPEHGVEKMFTEAQIGRLTRLLASRIASDLKEDEPLWNREIRWAPLLYIAAGNGRRPAVTRSLKAWLALDPADVGVFLSGVAGRARNLSSGDEIQEDLDSAKYASITQLIALTRVRAAVKRAFPKIHAPDDFPDASTARDPTGAVVEQFLWQEAKRKREAATAISTAMAEET